ncbi:ABC transporter substrate-binding protein [Fusibacter sp. JL216-2]|uniref:ABC transporter substrate-binding protein n=1 Tax=Fusibacter sp. JL216-2 TaxID=3071453 RepID=UPI003D332206
MFINKKTNVYALILILILQITTTPVSYGEDSYGIPDEVTLQLRWEHQFQFAGYYAALWEGYYEDYGLKVNIKPGIDDKENVILVPDAVYEGQAEFGVGGVDILLAVDKGHDLKIISTFFQRSPVAYYMRPDTDFNSIYDMTRLNVARRQHDLLDIELQAMLVNEGIDPSRKDTIPKDVVLSYSDLHNGTFDVIPGYLDTIAYQAKLQGESVKSVHPISFGVDFYGDSLFTSTALARSRPKLVERFREASILGWKYALDNPEEMAQRIADHYYKDSRNYLEFVDFNTFQAEKVSELTLYPVVEIGNTNPFRWTSMIDYLKALKLIESDISTDHLLFDYAQIQKEKSELYIRLYQSLLAFLAIAGLFSYIWYMNKKNLKLKSEVAYRKEAEQRISISHDRYQRMFNSSFLGITVTDINGQILNANDKWAEMTLYDHDELLNMKIFDILSPESKAAGKVEFKKLRDKDVQDIVLERKYTRKDGSIFWGQLYMTSIRDPETKASNFLGMVHDITEKRLQREAAERAEAMMIHQARQAAMGEMLGNIAHQWRQPLNNLGLIIANIEDAYKYDDLDDQGLFDASHRAKSLIRQMSETIDDFQDFLSPNMDTESFNLEDMLDNVVEMIQDNLNINKITLVRTGRVSGIVEGQKNQLAQAIFNLINNAVDATVSSETEKREIIIRTQMREKQLGEGPIYTASIQVEDHAGGVPENLLHNIFDPYFTTKPKNKGTGLGLYITKSIVENTFNGSVSLTQTPMGSLFEIEIPLMKNTH